TALLSAQTHGATQIGGVAAGFHGASGIGPLGDKTDHRMLAVLVELGGVGISPAQHIASELDYRHLHAKADAKVGDLVFASVLNGGDLAFHATQTEATRNQNRVHAFQQAGTLVFDVFGVDITE